MPPRIDCHVYSHDMAPTAKKSSKKSAKKTSAKKNYSDPKLREQLKDKITKGDKGGRPGQWSARKAQLLAAEYEKAGGTYTAPRSERQKSLKKWGEEEWHTADGKPAKRGKTMARYLPDKAWDKLTPAEKKATDEKKQSASKKGQQFVKNTKKAAKAGAAVRKKPTKKTAKKSAKKTAK